MGVFEIRIQNRLLELGIPHAPTKFVRKHGRLPGSINYYRRMELLDDAVFHLSLYSVGALSIKEYSFDLCLLIDSRTLFRGVFNQHEIELGAGYLPGYGRLVMAGLKEIERTRFLAGRICELDAIFPHKRALSHLFQEAHALKRKIGVGHQRFTDVVPRKSCLLEKHNFPALARQDTGDATTCRPTTNDDYIIVSINLHFVFIRNGLFSILVQRIRKGSDRLVVNHCELRQSFRSGVQATHPHPAVHRSAETRSTHLPQTCCESIAGQ